MLPVNELTLPELVVKYTMAYLLMGGRLRSIKVADNNKTRLTHCLQSDGGIFCSSATNVAAIALDAQLLGRAINKVSGKLRSVRNTLSMGIKGESSDASIPEWAKGLDPVKKLPTNVGSRIRSCEVLLKNPPESANKLLEASTKRAVIAILKRAASDVPVRPLSLDVDVGGRSSELLISKIIMKKCRSILRNVAANYDRKRDLFNLAGNILKSDEIKVVFESASRRPLDFPIVDSRFPHDTYGGSPQAFLADVRELWANLFVRNVDTNIIRKNRGETKTNLTKKCLGFDSVGRIYWGFPYVNTHSGIVINELNTNINPFDHPTNNSKYNDCGQWYLFRSDEEVSNLLDYLTINDPHRTELRDSISLWHTRRKRLVGGETFRSTCLNRFLSQSRLATNVTVVLEARYGLDMEPDEAKCIKKPKGKNITKWHKCECLELVFPSRHHCASCHETFFTAVEFEHHKNSTCAITLDCLTRVGSSSLSGNSDRVSESSKNFTVPESSSNPLVGNTRHILGQLLMSLLDMEAALPDMTSPKWRFGWCSFVKSANTMS